MEGMFREGLANNAQGFVKGIYPDAYSKDGSFEWGGEIVLNWEVFARMDDVGALGRGDSEELAWEHAKGMILCWGA